MSTLDGHLCECGHARRVHLNGCCTLGCGCKLFKRSTLRRQASGTRRSSLRLPKSSLIGRIGRVLSYETVTGQ